MSELQLNPRYTESVAILVNRSPYFSLLSMEIKDLQWGTCVMEVELGEKHLQPFGNVHGGAIASVVDAAAFWAVFPQVERGKGLTTVEMKLNYLAPVQKGNSSAGPLRQTGEDARPRRGFRHEWGRKPRRPWNGYHDDNP